MNITEKDKNWIKFLKKDIRDVKMAYYVSCVACIIVILCNVFLIFKEPVMFKENLGYTLAVVFVFIIYRKMLRIYKNSIEVFDSLTS